jgi:AAA+ superfamily predicted ATPase
MEGERIFQSSLVTGRIMIDSESFCRVNSGNRVRFDGQAVPYNVQLQIHDGPTSTSGQEGHATVTVTTDIETKTKRPVLSTLSEKDLLLCPPFVLGFSLLSKKWCRFIIDYVSELELNSEAFNQLIIADSHKELIQAMVESHVEGSDSFDDFIQGKGKSLIFLLHGAPGVGKTLTAESIADYTKRPLYTVSSGELGTDPTEVEEKLTHVLDLATTWKAVVLLDEADVFLQQRSGSDVKRNALVSSRFGSWLAFTEVKADDPIVFLRLLEYYEGILFLTSNRVESFDLAFKSRIHIALRYPELTVPVRRQLWRDFLVRIPENERNLDLERDLSTLEKDEINGRQIKNACKTAAALARKRREKLEIRHLETTLATIREFEKDFSGGARHSRTGISESD